MSHPAADAVFDRGDTTEQYFERHGWPSIPTEFELTRADGYMMSAWNRDGLPYIVRFNWTYLTEVCTEPGEKEAIHAHLRGLWARSTSSTPRLGHV